MYRARLRCAILASQFSNLSSATLCNLPNGNAIDSANTVPCNSNATGTEGSHSTCRNRVNSEACLSSGLCLDTEATVSDGILWATGCTDRTIKDKACPKVCLGHHGKSDSPGEKKEARSRWKTTKILQDEIARPVSTSLALRSCSANGTSKLWCCSPRDALDDESL